MPIRINQTFARIGIQTVQGRLEMRTGQPKLELLQNLAKVAIHTEQPKIVIDQSEAFGSANLKNLTQFSREMTELAYNHVMEYIGKTAEDGDMLAAIEKGGNPLIDIAERDAYPEHEFGYDLIPKVGPKISLVDGYVWVDPGLKNFGAHNGVEGKFIPGYVNYNYKSGSVTINLRQKASLSFTYEPHKLDLYL